MSLPASLIYSLGITFASLAMPRIGAWLYVTVYGELDVRSRVTMEAVTPFSARVTALLPSVKLSSRSVWDAFRYCHDHIVVRFQLAADICKKLLLAEGKLRQIDKGWATGLCDQTILLIHNNSLLICCLII